MGDQIGVGIHPIAVGEIILGVEAETEHILHFDGGTDNLGSRTQAVVKTQYLQIGIIFHIARSLGHQQGNRLLAGGANRPGAARGLTIRVHPDLVVIANGKAEAHLDDLGLVAVRPGDKTGTIEVIAHADGFAAVGSQKTGALETAFHDRFKTNLLGALGKLVYIRDFEVGAPLKVSSPTNVILGRIVAQDDLDPGNGLLVLVDRKLAGNQTALETGKLSVRVVGIDHIAAHSNKITHLGGNAPAEKRSIVGLPEWRIGCTSARGINAGINNGGLVFVGGKVPLQTIELRFGKGHGGQYGAQTLANTQRIVILALVVRRNQQRVEPTAEAPVFVERIAELSLWLFLGVVVDQPATRYQTTVDIVEIIPFETGVDVALEVVAGIVGVLPLAPLVFIIKFLRHVPFAHGGIQGPREYAGALWLVTESICFADAQARPVVRRLCKGIIG